MPPRIAGLVRAIAAVCFLHCGLSGASQSPQIPTTFDRVIAEGKKQSDAGRFTDALPVFARAERIARDSGNFDDQAVASIWSGLCEIHLFQYRAAVESLQTGARLAADANDRTRAGVAHVNLALVYDQLGDFAFAEREQQDAIYYLTASSRPDALAEAWLQFSFIQISRGKSAGVKESFDQAIALAKGAKLPATEALAWDICGTTLLLQGHIGQAELALDRAYSIRERIHDIDGLALSREHRAELELQRGEYGVALRDIDEALRSAGALLKSSPPYLTIHARAQILLGLGRKSEALSEFRRAVDTATLWRQSAMPGDASSTQTVAFLHDVYQDYADLAAELAIERNDSILAGQAFEALAENRAASLREQMALALSRNSQLPPHYYELLSELQAAQARVTLGDSSAQNQGKLQGLYLEISDLEDQIGLKDLNVSGSKEKKPIQNSLKNIQRRLGPSEVLFSFCLGNKKSFLWAVTGDDVNLYRLPAENDIATKAMAFSEAVRLGRDASQASSSLSQELFGKLTPAVWHKRDWLITADGALLNGVPFALLADLESHGYNQPLIANHTLRSLPSELLLLSSDTSTPANRFVGVADPIYNLADSRRAKSVTLIKAANNASALTLGRLAGSDREIRAAAKGSGIADVQLLTGAEATSTSLRKALAKAPEVLHFAVHVVSPEGQPEEAALALSLTKENMPELLTREAIAQFRVPGSLVVLSGCSSEQGRTLPSAGVIGLSRAWLLAGATAVLVSAWPTPDDSGPFFSAFYSHLQSMKSDSLSSRAAAALQQAQLDMQRSKSYRNSPSFWAAYSIVSKD